MPMITDKVPTYLKCLYYYINKYFVMETILSSLKQLM